MLTSFSPTTASASELRYAAAQLGSAAQIVRDVRASIPGPETLSGFSGVVRLAFDAFVASRIERLALAEYELEGASWDCQRLADTADRAITEVGR
ncbi:MAG TPA: hypothetical protein VFM95_08685 [Microcella sp.]|nr:hypothetical protein [Microcella sp.]